MEITNFDQLFREVAPHLWRAIFVYSAGRPEIADDAVAEAFARAMQYSDSVQAFEPWLYRVAFRIAAAELRRQAERESETEQGTEEHDDLHDLLMALRKLSPKQRAAIVLRYEVGLSVREVAERIGSSSGAVRVHLHAGRNRLRLLLSEEDDA